MYFAPSFLPFPGGAVTRIPESKRRRVVMFLDLDTSQGASRRHGPPADV